MKTDESIYARPEVRRSSTLSIIDLALANLMLNLTSGAFQQGFAINILGATDTFIGLMLALPGLMSIFQLAIPRVVSKNGSRKKASMRCAMVGRLLWLLIPLLAFYPFTLLGEVRLWIFLLLLTISSLFTTICNGVTFAWIGDLVPPGERGNYFGKRSMPAGFAILAFSFGAARFLDKFNTPGGFAVVFLFATFAGVLGIFIKSKMVEPVPLSEYSSDGNIFVSFRRCFENRNFRFLLLFTSFWNFAVMLGSAFYSPHLVGELKLSYTLIIIGSIVGNIAVTGFSGFWGRNIDSFGSRPVIFLSSVFKIIMPTLWIWITPYNPGWLIGTQLLNLFNQGITIGTNNLLLTFSSSEDRDAYVSVYNAVTGLASALAPAVGGLLLPSLRGVQFEFLGVLVSHYQILFIASSILRVLAITPLLFIEEKGAATVKDMFRGLKEER
jgi:MFS family permease